uniref:Uncharacterized protein n=1 Tax=Meloidogyne floridensis TaxID=298350 RepID=A0A915NGZ1_9BILA
MTRNGVLNVQRPGSNNFTIVTASNAEYFDTLKKLLYLLKNKFGCSQKIIGYDLGGISENKTMEIYSQYDTFMYMDTSIVIDDAASFNPIYEAIDNEKISETIFPGVAIHSIQFGTNHRE